jgi:bifunctional non-homologous end joining protein LigD
VLFLRGKDLRPLPLLKRKAALEKELKRTQRIVYCQHVGESGKKLFQAADQLGLEGARFEKDNGRAIRSTAWLIERADAPYRRGRSSDWVKIKTPGTLLVWGLASRPISNSGLAA